MTESSERGDEDALVEITKRTSLFTRLRDGPMEKGELPEQLPVSRSTVQRATNSFVEQGLLREEDDRVALTETGHHVAESLQAVRTKLRAADHLAPFLDALDADVDVPVESFADAEVFQADSSAVHSGTKQIVDLITEADSLRMFSNVVSPFYIDALCREALDGTDVDAIFDGQAVEILFENYGSKSRQAAKTGRFNVRLHDEIPFELFLSEERVTLASYGEDAIQRVFVQSDDRDVVSWTGTLYETYQQQSEFVRLF
ncbi:helix-turn-helix transcriptional regulator [Halorussus halophilus]|uniref:helix-turn-helix transcriptional regulator n=1 Tax=Halorussus halophilus TaxID=2650975 RepID=UPI00130175B1|nr:hypothetical protein [Halorussus halophilus]